MEKRSNNFIPLGPMVRWSDCYLLWLGPIEKFISVNPSNSIPVPFVKYVKMLFFFLNHQYAGYELRVRIVP